MTKADIIARIAQDTGIEKSVATTVVEAFMESVRESMIAGNEVFLRGFGSCLLYTSPSPRDKRQSRMPSSA